MQNTLNVCSRTNSWNVGEGDAGDITTYLARWTRVAFARPDLIPDTHAHMKKVPKGEYLPKDAIIE